MKKIYRVEIYAEDYNGYGETNYYPLSDFYVSEEEAKKVAEKTHKFSREELNAELIIVGGYMPEELFRKYKAEVLAYDLHE